MADKDFIIGLQKLLLDMTEEVIEELIKGARVTDEITEVSQVTNYLERLYQTINKYRNLYSEEE